MDVRAPERPGAQDRVKQNRPVTTTVGAPDEWLAWSDHMPLTVTMDQAAL